LPYGEMTLENIRSTAPVKEKTRIRRFLVLPEALLVIGFGGVIILGARAWKKPAALKEV
jgi:hypothetical protein